MESFQHAPKLRNNCTNHAPRVFHNCSSNTLQWYHTSEKHMTHSVGLVARTNVKLITKHRDETWWPCWKTKCETAENTQVDLCVLKIRAQTDQLHETNRRYSVKHLNAKTHMDFCVCMLEQCVES